MVDLVDQSLHALAYERDKKQEQVLMMIKSENFHFFFQAPPRDVRAAPMLIQSMVQSAVVQSVPIHVGQRPPGAATQQTASK